MPELPQNFGTQVYEQRIVELENRGEELAQVRVLGGDGLAGRDVTSLSPFFASGGEVLSQDAGVRPAPAQVQ